jgi:hypothetical protein
MQMEAANQDRRTIRRKVVVVGAAAVLAGIACLGWVWVSAQASEARVCTAAGSLDEVGGKTPEEARVRWAAEYDLDVDIDSPDRTSSSGDSVTAQYRLADPEPVAGEPDRTAFREITTERGVDDVWRVVSANRCERWTTA